MMDITSLLTSMPVSVVLSLEMDEFSLHVFSLLVILMMYGLLTISAILLSFFLKIVVYSIKTTVNNLAVHSAPHGKFILLPTLIQSRCQTMRLLHTPLAYVEHPRRHYISLKIVLETINACSLLGGPLHTCPMKLMFIEELA